MTGRRRVLAAGLGGLLPGMIGTWAQVVLGAYSAALDSEAVEQAVAIRMRDGGEVLPTVVEQARGSGDHREAVLLFSSSLRSGSIRSWSMEVVTAPSTGTRAGPT